MTPDRQIPDRCNSCQRRPDQIAGSCASKTTGAMMTGPKITGGYEVTAGQRSRHSATGLLPNTPASARGQRWPSRRPRRWLQSELAKAAQPRAAPNCSTAMPRITRSGPHDQPQSMCPAFGSLRVGLRMKRVATVLSGSACCVYGLTFVSHFYGARRSVGYVPFNSETLVTGKLFEDIRESVHDLADPDRYDAIVVTNLCVPTASGVPLRLLPREINGVRIVGIDVPGFGIPTHAEAKDVLAGAMLAYAREEIKAGPVQGPVGGKSDRPTVSLLLGKCSPPTR
jgi:hypothetical protein